LHDRHFSAASSFQIGVALALDAGVKPPSWSDVLEHLNET
jgi:hypothetical protein